MELYSLNGLIEILNISGEQAELYDKCNWFITCLLKRTTLNDKRKECFLTQLTLRFSYQ